ncbi:MAG: lamin tail domain-containing protein [Candidatus Altiarchaeota archaeon]|nr:lamin tail domain-containing protein [Candidatus Altiarchaeota archaeon]
MNHSLRDRRGWVVWSISKLGVLMAVMLIFLMLFMIYRYTSCINASDSANQVAEGFARTLVEVYSGPVGMETRYTLPAKIINHRYNLSIINHTGQGVLINVLDTRCGVSTGGAPFNIPLAGYPVILKNSTEENITLILRNLDEGVYIGRNNCASCITIPYFHYNATGNDCFNLNDEYVVFKNSCDIPCNLTGWTVKDRIESRPPYEFLGMVLDPESTVTLYTGCGINTTTELYWCSSGYPCNAVWNNDGDTLYLRDPGGYLCLEYGY